LHDKSENTVSLADDGGVLSVKEISSWSLRAKI
jgi:hypothetical protein